MVNGRRATFGPIMPATLMNSERSVDCGRGHRPLSSGL